MGTVGRPATGAVELGYALDDRRFTETFRFPAADPGIVAARGAAIARAVRLLHLVAGVSYYKAAVPPEIAVDGPAPAPATARALELLWTGGLGEFAWHNDLPWIGQRDPLPGRRRRAAARAARRPVAPVARAGGRGEGLGGGARRPGPGRRGRHGVLGGPQALGRRDRRRGGRADRPRRAPIWTRRSSN